MNNIQVNDLMDVYGSLLTSRQQEIMDLYTKEDLSYSEIAQELGISRTAVMDAVHKSVQLLEKYEKNIKFLQFKTEIYSIIELSVTLEECKRSLNELLTLQQEE
ncbi:YlxM family DNA-binding protein [Dubosiella muris]|uniref:HTH domain-containing protein n=1 Tax=Dubosiella muris TaxID=3038133 RepID=A0AC61R7G5_9FIRM|nr:sigma factor-like helix-turn-helix DNA-binding protein [Dubosiella muris]TGY65838.1 HTH domain-containing protein [Dubosiella muris]